MLQNYWLLILLICILTVIYFNFIIFLLTSILFVILAIYLALEKNAIDLAELNYFKNNRLFDLNEEINLIGKEHFLRTAFFNCLNPINFKTSPVHQLINRKQTCYQQKYNNLNEELKNKSSEIYTGDSKIDEQINDFINLVLRDYVYSWYSTVSTNQEFVNELKLVLQTIIRLIVGRLSKIDKINYITTKLVDNFVQHLKLYRMAKQHLKTNNLELTDQNLKEAFFNLELKSQSNRFCRDAVSENNEFCLNYLTELTNILEYLILPPDLFDNRAVKYFINSIIINSTFYPLLELLSDSDFINQSLISICKSKKLTISLSESFLIILRSSANKDELNAVLKKVREEIALQRSKDTGGDDDFEIKQQLSSLCYVNSLIKERLKLLNETNLNDAKINYQEEDSNFNSQKNDLYSLTFDFVITNPLALTYFFEYMITINKQSYLNFYLSVEGFRVSVEQKLVSILMKENQNPFKIQENEFNNHIDGKINNGQEIKEGDNELSSLVNDEDDELNEREFFELNNEIQEKLNEKTINEDDKKLIQKLEKEMKQKLDKLKKDNEKAIWLDSLLIRAREEARSIYETYLSPSSSKNRINVEDWQIQDLKRKIDYEELSETWFDTIHQSVYRRLREEEMFYNSFKKSIHYYKLLKELGLLKNSSLKEKNNSNYNEKSNGSSNVNHIYQISNSNLNNNAISSNQQSQVKNNFYLEVDNDSNSIKSNHSSYDTESIGSLQEQKSTHELLEINSLPYKQETELTSIKNDNSIIMKLDADITSTGITKEFGKEFGVYCINIVKKEGQNSSNNFKEEKWCIVRRYSDFYTFHQQTIKSFPHLRTKIDLPGKKPFANMSQEFLEQRKQSLNSYLKNLLNILNNIQTTEQQQTNLDKLKLKDHILKFFDSGNYLPTKNNNSQILTKTMNTVLNPFKSIKNKQNNIIEGIAKIKPFGSNIYKEQDKHQQFNKQKSTPNRLIPTNHLTPSFSSSSLSNLQFNQNQPNLSPKNQPTNLLNQLSNQFSTNSQNDLPGAKNNTLIESEANIPLRILLLLMDEIFDLKSKSFWLRRRIFNVIKQIIQTTYGNTINRKIIAFLNRLFSSSSIESYIKTIKKTLWPNGYRAIPTPERDEQTKLRTKIATKMLLLSIIPDDLTHVIGSETSRKSIIGLFNMLQCNVLNRRLVIVIFETFLIQLFPENEFDKVFERLHSTGTKNKDRIENTNSDLVWPPYLSKINSNLSSNSNSDQSSTAKTSPICNHQI